MRRLSRGRLAALSSIVLALVTAPAAPGAASEGLSVRITSPLGRTGGVGTVRIVAQIQRPSDAALAPVRFYVDGTLLKTDDDGPPYAVEWTDENPFERRELAVEVEDSDGRKGRDRVVLEAFEITEISEVASVLLEAGVYDRKGRFVSGLNSASFAVKEDGVAQAIDLVSHERVPATFALLIDSSQSMSRRFDFVKDAAARLTAFLRPKDSVVVAPFAKRLGALTGPTGDRRTIIEAIQHIEPTGGTAILDALIELSERLPRAEDRRSVILISDGYDEHSHASFEEALAAVKSAGHHDLCRRHRRRRRNLAQGRTRAEAARERDRRPGVLSAAGRRARGRVRPARGRRAEPLSGDIYADEHRARRGLARCQPDDVLRPVRRADARRLSSAEAAADPSDARVHGDGSRPASTSRSAPTTSSSPRTASIRRSTRSTKRKRPSRSCSRSMPAAACGSRLTR